MFKNLVLIAHYMSILFRFTRDCLTWLSIIERQLQLCLCKLQQWATDNSFRLCMHICHYFSIFNYTTISCIYLFLTPNIRSSFVLGCR